VITPDASPVSAVGELGVGDASRLVNDQLTVVA
jgi:hypothetical protein